MTIHDDDDHRSPGARPKETWEPIGAPARRSLARCRPGRREEAEGDFWGGNLTPMPLSDNERHAFRALASTMRHRSSLPNAIRRLAFIRDAHGLGLAIGMDMDTDVVDGVRLALQALVLLDAVRPPTDRADARAKRERLGRHLSLGVGHHASVLRHCLAGDARARRPRPGART